MNSAGSVQMVRQMCLMSKQIVATAAKDLIGKTSRTVVHVKPHVPLAILRGETVLTSKRKTEDIRVSVPC